MKRVVLAGGLVGFLPAAIFIAMTAGFRMDVVSFGDVFAALKNWLGIALVGGTGILLVSGILGVVTRSVGAGVLALILAVGSGTILYKIGEMKRVGGTVPPIHDISTDTIDPPNFVVTAAERTEGQNSPAYDGTQSAPQIEAYPDLTPIVVSAGKEDAFAAALAAMKSIGIAVKAKDMNAWTIEGTATTVWFGFQDDVIIRLRDGEGDVTVIDIRSKSRIGVSDLGANASRIRRLREAILKRVDAADV